MSQPPNSSSDGNQHNIPGADPSAQSESAPGVPGGYGTDGSAPAAHEGGQTAPDLAGYGQAASEQPGYGSENPTYGSSTTPTYGSSTTPTYGSENPTYGSATTPTYGSATTPSYGSSMPAAASDSGAPSYGSTPDAAPTSGSATPTYGSTPDAASTSGGTGTPGGDASAAGGSTTPGYGSETATPAYGGSTTAGYGGGQAPTPTGYGGSTTAGYGSGETAPSTPQGDAGGSTGGNPAAAGAAAAVGAVAGAAAAGGFGHDASGQPAASAPGGVTGPPAGANPVDAAAGYGQPGVTSGYGQPGSAPTGQPGAPGQQPGYGQPGAPGAPQPGYNPYAAGGMPGQPPMPVATKPKRRNYAGVVVGLLVAVVVGYLVWNSNGGSNVTLAVGDCITVTKDDGSSSDYDHKKVDCTNEADPTYTVIQKSTASTCPKNYSRYSITEQRRSSSITTYYCLMPNFAQDKCYRDSTTATQGYAIVTCDSSAEFKVTKVVDGKADEAACAEGEDALLYTLTPARTYCLADPA